MPYFPPCGDERKAGSAEFSRRKKSTIVVRHISGDRVVAMIEVISPGNKSGYIEPVEFGDIFPDMPLFLELGRFVDVPLEHTYANAWQAMPDR